MMEFEIAPGIRRQLSFYEANILVENMSQKTNLGGFIARLDTLSRNTQDVRLLSELESLLSKIKELSPREFAKLKQDTLQGRVMFPPDYTL